MPFVATFVMYQTMLDDITVLAGEDDKRNQKLKSDLIGTSSIAAYAGIISLLTSK